MSSNPITGECPRCYRNLPVRPSDALIPWHLDGNNHDCPGEGQEPSPIKYWAVDGLEVTKLRVIPLTEFEAHTGGFEEHQLLSSPIDARENILRLLDFKVKHKVDEMIAQAEALKTLCALAHLVKKVDPATLNLANLDPSVVKKEDLV